jgi:hypothetical protein
MLLLTILGYYKLFQPKLFLAIFGNSNIWILVDIILVLIGYFSIGVIDG